MRSVCFLTLVLLFSFGKLPAQSFSGTLVYGTSSLDFEVILKETEGQTKAFFTCMRMNAYEVPCQNTSFNQDTLKFDVISDHYTYAYAYIRQNEHFQGNLKIYANAAEELLNSFETTLIKTDPEKENEIEKREVVFVSDGLQLYGSLWQPQKSLGKGLLYVSSSQGNDRSGTNAEAYFFAQLGYTVFNYDKRGTGRSEGNWQLASIEELCSDDINALHFFSEISTLSLSDIGIKGSSQGGIKIPYILSKLPELDFGISISCPDGTLLESDLNHWKNVNGDQIGEINMGQAFKLQKAGYDYVAGNISYETLAQLNNENHGADWLPYVWIPEPDVQKDKKLNFSGLPYFEKVTQPILVVQGLADEVIPIQSYKTIENTLKKSQSTHYEVITLENTSHAMMLLDKDFPYFQILHPSYIATLKSWMQKDRHE